ncbi:unnamed protein product [Mucor hiemalis]
MLYQLVIMPKHFALRRNQSGYFQQPKQSAEPPKKTSSPTHSTSSSTSTQRRQTAEPPVSDRKYTTEQVRAVKTILACAYRKQALQFHPDKNSAPGADEAFKLVAKAFDILSDSNKRAIHDEGGDAMVVGKTRG